MNLKTIPVSTLLRVWSSKQIFWATVFGGYLCGFFLLHENYKALGYFNLAKKAFFTGIFSTLIAIGAGVFLPEHLIPCFLFSLSLTPGIIGIGYLIHEHYKIIYNRDHSRQTFLWLPLSALFLLTAPFYIPKQWIASIPKFLFPCTTAMIISSFAQIYQDSPIKGLLERGSKKNSIRRLLTIAILAILSQLLYLFALAFLF